MGVIFLGNLHWIGISLKMMDARVYLGHCSPSIGNDVIGDENMKESGNITVGLMETPNGKIEIRWNLKLELLVWRTIWKWSPTVYDASIETLYIEYTNIVYHYCNHYCNLHGTYIIIFLIFICASVVKASTSGELSGWSARLLAIQNHPMSWLEMILSKISISLIVKMKIKNCFFQNIYPYFDISFWSTAV